MDPQYAIFKAGRLPDIYWDINPNPRFKDIVGAKSDKQKALAQAQVFNSLRKNPRQLLEWPRRWRLGAYSELIDHSMFAMASIMKEALRFNMRAVCVPLSKLERIDTSRYDLIWVHSVYSDLEAYQYQPLRDAHQGNFHLFYSMDGNYKTAVDVLKISPDYAFNIESAQFVKAQARTI